NSVRLVHVNRRESRVLLLACRSIRLESKGGLLRSPQAVEFMDRNPFSLCSTAQRCSSDPWPPPIRRSRQRRDYCSFPSGLTNHGRDAADEVELIPVAPVEDRIQALPEVFAILRPLYGKEQ